MNGERYAASKFHAKWRELGTAAGGGGGGGGGNMENMAEVLEMNFTWDFTFCCIVDSSASCPFVLERNTKKNEKPLSPSAKVNRPTSNNWPTTTWEEKRRHMGFSLDAQKKFLADQKAKKEDNFLFSSADFYKGVHVNGALSIPDTVPTHRNIVCISLHVPIWKWFCFFFLRRFTRLLNKHWRYGQNLSLIGKVAHGNSSLISGLKITAMLSDFVFCLHFQQYCFLIFVLWLMEKAWATRGAIFSW